jgi:hypothetical protein
LISSARTSAGPAARTRRAHSGGAGASGERLADERVVADAAGARERLVGPRRRLLPQAQVEVDLGDPDQALDLLGRVADW